ncbi:cytoplasmic protein [Stenotrophomonas ginsengisoli]|uniref:Cytoplasmic protein n=1 Tax=Stenotrophomonas ginsengisoli TaxID=336566 RepID=A0A0R0DKI3_9GAMM|nr:crosslink repair DNA glycosylase YcaQ family protein [Stenotrophomonas ginsengisoli]KRG78179.1 cytoplasmic protein [Stenotrophomonas ginsengisoli]
MSLHLDDLRRYAIARSLFKPTTLMRAITRMGFVQADPIRAPARAQDLTLRHRVSGYRAGELERRYPRLALEEDFFVNYGFLPRATQALLHPRQARLQWPAQRQQQALQLRAHVAAQGVVHPRDVAAAFDHGKVVTWFGGNAHATTELLDGMHYRGMLRVAGREGGTRLYALHLDELAANAMALEQRLEALVQLIAQVYAPLPLASFTQLVGYLANGGPQWKAACRVAGKRVWSQLGQATVDGVSWGWPADEAPASKRWQHDGQVRLLAPFDPVVWDRRRFELFWGWRYRFEAYTPAAKRQLGYYAMPLLWRGQVIGWGNLTVRDGQLQAQLQYVAGKAPADAAYAQALAAELAAMGDFLGLGAAA